MLRRWEGKSCLFHIVSFELLFKLLLLGVVHPSISQILNWYLSEHAPLGTAYNGEVLLVFASFWGVVLLGLFVVVSLALVFYEYAVLIQLVFLWRSKQPYSMGEVLATACGQFSLVKSRYFPVVYLHLVLLNPIIHTGFFSSFLPVLEIPNFITGELLRTGSGKVLVFAFYLVLFLVYLFLSFVPIFMVVDQVNWKESLKKAIAHYKVIGPKGWGKILLMVVPTFLLDYEILQLLPFRLLTSGDFNWYFFRYLYHVEEFRYSVLIYVLLSLYWLATELMFLWVFLGSILQERPGYRLPLQEELPPVTQKVVSFGKSLWGTGKEKLVQPLLTGGKNRGKNGGKPSFYRRHRVLCLVSLGAVVFLGVVAYLNQFPLVHEPWVIGHRGDITAPENSLEGILQADAYRADYAEIDVQFSKDGEVVVMHDSNLSRLTGESVEVSAQTWDALSQLTVSNHGKTASIPSLRQAIEAAQGAPNGVGLLIELKPQPGEAVRLAEATAKLVEELGFEEGAIFMSLDYEAVSYLQETRPEWWVGYCVFGVLGKIDTGAGADFLAVEESQLNTRFLEDARNNDLPVYVWTTDDSTEIENYLRLGVSGIIGDSVENVYQAVENYRLQTPHYYLYTGRGYPKRNENGTYHSAIFTVKE